MQTGIRTVPAPTGHELSQGFTAYGRSVPYFGQPQLSSFYTNSNGYYGHGQSRVPTGSIQSQQMVPVMTSEAALATNMIGYGMHTYAGHFVRDSRRVHQPPCNSMAQNYPYAVQQPMYYTSQLQNTRTHTIATEKLIGQASNRQQTLPNVPIATPLPQIPKLLPYQITKPKSTQDNRDGPVLKGTDVSKKEIATPAMAIEIVVKATAAVDSAPKELAEACREPQEEDDSEGMEEVCSLIRDILEEFDGDDDVYAKVISVVHEVLKEEFGDAINSDMKSAVSNIVRQEIENKNEREKGIKNKTRESKPSVKQHKEERLDDELPKEITRVTRASKRKRRKTRTLLELTSKEYEMKEKKVEETRAAKDEHNEHKVEERCIEVKKHVKGTIERFLKPRQSPSDKSKRKEHRTVMEAYRESRKEYQNKESTEIECTQKTQNEEGHTFREHEVNGNKQMLDTLPKQSQPNLEERKYVEEEGLTQGNRELKTPEGKGDAVKENLSKGLNKQDKGEAARKEIEVNEVMRIISPSENKMKQTSAPESSQDTTRSYSMITRGSRRKRNKPQTFLSLSSEEHLKTTPNTQRGSKKKRKKQLR